MKTKTRSRTEAGPLLEEDEYSFDLDQVSDEELEALLFDDEQEATSGFWNLPTVAGLSMVVVGIAYTLQQLGWTPGLNLPDFVEMLPFLAGILIILLGFGVLNWSPRKKKKKIKVKAKKSSTGKEKIVVEEATPPAKARKRLSKSRDKKVAGVCGGIADYFNLDPTLIRIAFVIATIASGGNFLLAYLILAIVMPKPEQISPKERLAMEERITIIRDS